MDIPIAVIAVIIVVILILLYFVVKYYNESKTCSTDHEQEISELNNQIISVNTALTKKTQEYNAISSQFDTCNTRQTSDVAKLNICRAEKTALEHLNAQLLKRQNDLLQMSKFIGSWTLIDPNRNLIIAIKLNGDKLVAILAENTANMATIMNVNLLSSTTISLQNSNPQKYSGIPGDIIIMLSLQSPCKMKFNVSGKPVPSGVTNMLEKINIAQYPYQQFRTMVNKFMAS